MASINDEMHPSYHPITTFLSGTVPITPPEDDIGNPGHPIHYSSLGNFLLGLKDPDGNPIEVESVEWPLGIRGNHWGRNNESGLYFASMVQPGSHNIIVGPNVAGFSTISETITINPHQTNVYEHTVYPADESSSNNFVAGNTDPVSFGNTNVAMDFSSGPGGEVSVYRFDENPPATEVTTLPHYWDIVTDMPNDSFSAIVTFNYDELEVLNAGLTEENLVVAFFDSIWHSIDTAIDIASNKVSINTTHLSLFSIGNFVSTCVTFDFPVAGGAWYLISLPVMAGDNSLTALFPNASAAFGWDFTTQTYNEVTTLDPEKAYWLLMLNTGTAGVCGQPLSSYTTNYTVQGWDMIGSVVDVNSMVVDNPDGSVQAMFSWDPSTQSYGTVTPHMVEPMQGYWSLIFNVPCAVTVGDAGSTISVAKSGAAADVIASYKQFGSMPPGPPSFVTSGNESQNIPESFGLSQNYPNPFNPETVIQYQLPEPGRVSLKVYSVLGQEVRTLVDEERAPGYHWVIWDGKNDAGAKLASGVYLYRIQVGEFVQTRKVVLLK